MKPISLEEYQDKCAEIRNKIYNYRMHNIDLHVEITLTEKEITKLNNDLTELHYEFTKQNPE